MVKISEIMDSIWIRNFNDSISFFHMAFSIGIFRIYPGVSIHKRYEPVNMPW